MLALLLLCMRSVHAAPTSPFQWIRDIASGPPGQKIALDAKTYLIDAQYQLPSGTELRGAGTVPGRRTRIQAVGQPYAACAGSAKVFRKGLLLGDDTFVGGFHFVGMETKRLDCLYAPVETPGCANSESRFIAAPNETQCGGDTGNSGHGVRNATVEDVTVEPFTTQNLFFMAPTKQGARVSSHVTARNLRSNGTWADGVNIHGEHANVLVEGCTVVDAEDDSFAMWSIGVGLENVTFQNNRALHRKHPGRNCCFVNFGGLTSAFLDSYGEGCGLTPRDGVPPGSEGLVVFGSPASVTPPLFGGAWNSSSVSVVRNVTGTCAGRAAAAACPLCKFLAGYLYPDGFPGRTTCPSAQRDAR